MSEQDERLARLPLDKRELVQKLLQEQGLSGLLGQSNRAAIRQVPRQQSLPLSFAQQRLWFLHQLDTRNAGYNVPLSIRLSGPLDHGALERSLSELVAHHESLRTSFPAAHGNPSQNIAPPSLLRPTEVDIRDLPADESTRELERRMDEEATRPFDLHTGPLLRAVLLRTGDEEHILLLTIHHIVVDGWSLGILFRELGLLYEAHSSGKPSPLAALPIQYADFAVWQREWLSGPVLDRQLSYWRERLTGVSTLLLPTDRPRPKIQTHAGARHVVSLTKEQKDSIDRLGRAADGTLFMTMLAAFTILLQRYSGQDDIVVGTPIANRTRAEIEGLVGFFVNSLVMRIDASGDPNFLDLVRRVRAVALGAYEHQELPFERLVEELEPERDTSRNPLFEVMFAVQNAPIATLDLGRVKLNLLQPRVRTARLDLEIHVWEDPGRGLTLWIIYNTDLFDQSTIERMSRHYIRVLEAVMEHPERPISQIELMTEAERRMALVEWNDTARAYPRESIQEMFQDQADKTPRTVAVEFGDAALSYAELNERANRVAHYLRDLGIDPDDPVGLCLERSLDMVVGILGVIKAGGACLPLDPQYPMDRLRLMLRDAKAPVLLTQAHLRERFDSYDGHVVCIDRDREKIIRSSGENPKSVTTPATLAYVIYTSGSTGVPKGVAMPHSALVNLLTWQMGEVGFAAKARTLQFTSLSFDVSFQEIFSTWCSGGTLVMVPESVRRDPRALAETMAHRRVHRVFLPFIALQQLAHEFNAGVRPPTDLKEVITAGEQLQVTPALIAMFERLPGCTLTNQYGPTETHVATSYRLRGEPRRWPSLPAIGKPIGNEQVYVLDDRMRPVPVGAAGELYLGGAGLARGYINQPIMTAERFIANPFTTAHGERLYRTGDRVRYLADGNIEFLGRSDRQIKLRGYRIELGEIEAALCRHPSINQAVVDVRPVAGDTRLVAYVVADAASPSAENLRDFLKQTLPEYMVPSSYEHLDKLPLTPSGKIDRRSLPAPRDRPDDDKQYLPPRTPVEQALAEIWSKLLGVQRIGAGDNFFDLGGHSLLATQVVSRIRDALGADLPLNAIFAYPILGDLARSIENVRWARDSAAAVGLGADDHRQVGEL